jgi:endoglycosylceramidase
MGRTSVASGAILHVLATVCLLGSCAPPPPTIEIPLPPPVVSEPIRASLGLRDGWFVDEHGRVVVLHGANVVFKHPPYLPDADQFGPEDAALMRDLGFNTVRLGFIWAGLEPEPGNYDEAYLRRLVELTDMLGRHGLYVLIDSHQDVMSERFGGEGFPDWAVLTDGVPPLPAADPWWLNYLQPALNVAWRNFFADRNGVLGRYGAMWRRVAAELAGRPWVLGYDLLNEPWGTDDELRNFAAVVTGEIRAVDPTRLIFWEPGPLSAAGGPSYADPGTVVEDPAFAHSFHLYCPFGVLGAWNRFRNADRDRGRGGWLLTEFGATDDLPAVALDAALADEFLVGWQHWSWKTFDDPTGTTTQGMLVSDRPPFQLKPKVAFLERIYARHVAGRPISMRFDPISHNFELRYRPDLTIGAPTEIWVPARMTISRIDVEGGSWTQSADGRRLLVNATPDSPEVRVRIVGANG